MVMTGSYETRNGKHDESLVDFLARFTSSDQFEKVFREGMGLVEETANYLDGPGRIDARILDRHGAIAYATESMRLTTRLMQLASWLLLQRAVSSGELTPEDARKEKHRISLADIGPGHALAGSSQLPDALGDLIKRSLRLHERIVKLDAMIATRAKSETAGPNPVSTHLDRLAQVFKVAR
jgi:regulator of CtrA degradation